MTLAQLIDELPVAAPPGLDLSDWDLDAVGVTGVSHDSRRVETGDLFVAWRGERFDGQQFVADAVRRGAVAVVTSQLQKEKGPGSHALTEVPWLVAPDPRRLLAPLAARLYRHPDRELSMVGVTGTNGKTTVSFLITALLEAAGLATGTLGTLGCFFRGATFLGGQTTPEASDLHRILRAMRDRGAVAASMEVSSHALGQGRVAGVAFDVAVLTNLSRDHLDFHRDLEDYFRAKCRLFDQLADGGRAIVGIEDAFGPRLARQLDSCWTFGRGGDLRMIDRESSVGGIRGRVRTPRGELALKSPLIGGFNVSNLLAAIGAALALEVDLEVIETALPEIGPIPGRMEPVDAGQEFPVFVDYAHTEDALRAALDSLRQSWSGAIVVVFGCGGERDRGKRAPMGEVAARLADGLIVTDDNPRGEDPSSIHRSIVAGIRRVEAEGSKTRIDYEVIADRRLAIGRSLERAYMGGDVAVLIAGKGHEEVQSVGGLDLEFSDKRVALIKLGELLDSSTVR